MDIKYTDQQIAALIEERKVLPERLADPTR